LKQAPTGEAQIGSREIAPAAEGGSAGSPSGAASGRSGSPKAGGGSAGASGENAGAGGGNTGAGDANADAGGGTAGPATVPPGQAGGVTDPDTPVATVIPPRERNGILSIGPDPSQEPAAEPGPEASEPDIRVMEKASAEWVSPDGKWKAYAEDGVLKVAGVADGNVVYESAARKGQPVDVVWQADGTEIRVVWADDAGEHTVFVVNLATGQESLPEQGNLPADDRNESGTSSADGRVKPEQRS
jgi:hypothetical protein